MLKTLRSRGVGVARNGLSRPGYADLDLRLSHNFALLHHINFTSYVATVASPLFGQATAALPPRRIQLSLRTKF